MQVAEQTSSFETLFAAAFCLDESEVQDSDTTVSDDEVEKAVEINQALPEIETHATVGEQYKAIWLRYRKAIETWSHEQCAIRSTERSMVNPYLGEYMRAFEDMPSDDVRRSLEKKSHEIRKMLVWVAEKVFAPEGTRLKIDENDVFERFNVDKHTVDAFDPAAIWSYLEQKYGGDFGTKLAWQQVAKAFKSQFNLDTNEEVVIKSGYIVLQKRVWIDDFDKKLYKKNRLSYSCCESVSQAVNVLSEIARWSERHILGTNLLGLARTFNDRSYEIESRKQFPAGKDAEVVIITYTSRFEFRIRQDFAEQLQVFLGTFLEVEP